MAEVIASILILVLLTVISVAFEGNLSLLLASCGILMILITAGYLKDSMGKLMKISQLSLAVVFSVCSGNWWGCIAVAALLWISEVQVSIVSCLLYVCVFLIRYLPELSEYERMNQRQRAGYTIASGIMYLFILEIICLGIVIIRKMIRKNKINKEEERERLRRYSLGEMHEIRKNKELAMKSFYSDKNARLLERENISRNIHNSVGHSITAAIMTLDAADVLFDKNPEEAHKRMNDANNRIRGSLTAIRSAVRALDEESSDVTIRDLVCYFDNILDEFLMDTERSCERIYDIISDEYMLPREHAEFLTGALSELLTNGVKHGNASAFLVKLSGDKGHIRLTVSDNGTSDYNDDNSEQRIRDGFGLKKLTSYAERCGGMTEFRNENGFRSVIELPLYATDPENENDAAK